MLGTSSVLPKSVPKNPLNDLAQSSAQYRSVAYESQSSSGSSTATPSPSPSPSQPPSGEGFIPFDPAQAVSTPGSFVPAFNYDNSSNDSGTRAMQPVHRQPASTTAEGILSRSQSVPSDLSRQKSGNVLATYKRVKIIGSGGFAKVGYASYSQFLIIM